MKLKLIAISLLISAMASTPMFAAKSRLATELGLTKSQKAQFKSIRQQARQKAEPVTAQLKENRQALSAAIKSGDTAKIESLSKTQGELKGQKMAIRNEVRTQIYAGLNSDQRQKFDAMQGKKTRTN
jgi:Spy/CpxP family protein refolding chaperone